ncbi:hypothetical protein [Agaribacterium haliotis]|uniref:hypothetical protein n=1 Tax=Agaribacterium haliotis TaxID=2013869 RepID=UPI000BB53262|nr:hypothetical protein [Agaribacterium haliotis]
MRYLCPHHAARISRDEDIALSSWHELINRAMLAYMECRLAAAELYFCAAHEIAQLRLSLNGECNSQFNYRHLLRPLEFMLELLLGEEKYQQAKDYLHQTRRFLMFIQSDEQEQATRWLLRFHRQHREQLGDAAPALCLESEAEPEHSEQQATLTLHWELAAKA